MTIIRNPLLSIAVFAAMLSVTDTATAQDWNTSVKACVARKDFACAMSAVNEQLSAHPADFEARAWHARLLAWTGSWDSAQQEYEGLLATRGEDVDILLGLADVETWNGRFNDALTVLQRAEQLGAEPKEIWLRRARLYMRLGRKAEATDAYKALLRFSPSDQEARSAINSKSERRHELRIGSDTDVFNYTDTANAESISLASRWNERWSTVMSTLLFQRFGSDAAIADLAVTYRFTPHNWITVSGGGGNRQVVAPEEEVGAEYGRSSHVRFGIVRGLESYASTKRFWYSGSRVLSVGTTQIVYLPHDWIWTIRLTGVRTTFGSTDADWVPAGLTRLSWPVRNRVRINGLFAVGTENFSNIDQVGHFSGHTYGGGATVRLNDRQDTSCYFALQKRTDNRTQTSVGVAYAIRF